MLRITSGMQTQLNGIKDRTAAVKVGGHAVVQMKFRQSPSSLNFSVKYGSLKAHGVRDTKDNMQNIDLDYGAGLAAIVIETVARAATIRRI